MRSFAFVLIALVSSTLASPIVLEEPTLVARGVSKPSTPKALKLKNDANCHQTPSFSAGAHTVAGDSITATCYVFGEGIDLNAPVIGGGGDDYQNNDLPIYRSWAYFRSENCYIHETQLNVNRKWKEGLQKCEPKP